RTIDLARDPIEDRCRVCDRVEPFWLGDRCATFSRWRCQFLAKPSRQKPRRTRNDPSEWPPRNLRRRPSHGATAARQVNRLARPASILALVIQTDRITLVKGDSPPILPHGQSGLLVNGPHHAEGVLVKPEPDVQAVFLDAPCRRPVLW